jgi:hypothetical protein
MIDWSEGTHAMKRLINQLYEQMLSGQFAKAQETCDQIVVEARITRAQIQVQHERD